jgi:hypothetical protein
MALNIGRKGWVGIGLQTGFQVPAAIADYVDFTDNSLTGIQDSMSIDHATSLRDKLAGTIAGKQWSQGDFSLYADSTKLGYFLVSALGTVQTASLGSSVFRHTITRNNSNTPQYLTMTADRAVDRQLYPDICVDQLTLNVGTDIAEAKMKLVGNFPQTTTSGTKTTTSGNLFNFANAQFAFGTTISGAQSATPLKPHDFKLTINNNAEPVFAHSFASPRSVNYNEFMAEAEFTLYFESTTDRDAYYAQSKQAASLQLLGNGIGGGFREGVVFNFYKSSIESFDIETGLDNYYAEKVKLNCEFDSATQRTLDCVITNTKTLYI